MSLHVLPGERETGHTNDMLAMWVAACLPVLPSTCALLPECQEEMDSHRVGSEEASGLRG
jgi:hypothetical protein